MLALLPSRLPGEWPNFCCSATLSLCHFALAIQFHTALCKGFAQGDQNTSKRVSFSCRDSFSYAVHILPSGAAVPVESTSGLVKFFWVGRLTATSLAPIGYFRKLPKSWDWEAFHSCWFIRKTEEWAELTSAFYDCLCGCDPCKGDHPAGDRCKDLVFCTSTTALTCECHSRRKLHSSTKQTHMQLHWFIKLVFYHLYNIMKVVRSIVRSAYKLNLFHWFRALSNLKSVGFNKRNCNFNDYVN